MSDRFENDDTHSRHPEWSPTKRDCPFCTIDRRICGCPEAERLLDEAHLIRGTE